MRCEDVLWIVTEVKYRDEVGFCHFFDLCVGPIALSIERDVELVVEDGVIEHRLPLNHLLGLVIKDNVTEASCCGRIEGAKGLNSGILMSRRHHFFLLSITTQQYQK